jgi:hypothetical protein
MGLPIMMSIMQDIVEKKLGNMPEGVVFRYYDG